MSIRAGCAAAALLTLFAVPANAGVRVHRKLDWRSGLPSSFTDQIEQDPDGFLWITTMAGVVRYDGSEAKLLTGPLIRFVPGSAAVGHPLWMMADSAGRPSIFHPGGTPVPGPGGGDLRADGAFVTQDGSLWTIFDGTLHHRGETSWSGPLRPPDGVPIRRNPLATAK